MVGQRDEAFHGVPMPALRTKLNIPAARSTIIQRGHLTERLCDARERPPQLILVSAPAGYGKTTLVADWLRTWVDSYTWINLDLGDNDPIRFYQYLILALARIDERMGGSAFDLLVAPTGNEIARILDSLLADITELGSRFVLVLDDYHTISNVEIHEFVRTFIERQPQNIDVVLITREDPPFSLSRLRTQDRVTDIRAGDLKLSFDDTKRFLQTDLEFVIDDAVAEGLFNRTEGWLAGIKLAAHSLQGRDQSEAIRSLENFSGSDKYVVEYFADEIVRNLPADVSDFLFGTAFLTQIHTDLANEVTGTEDADRILSSLADESLFVYSIDAEEGWYRYHPLFAEYLRARRGGTVDRAARLIAVEWLRRRGMYLDSIRYAMDMKDYQTAIRIITDGAISLIELGRSSALLHWIESLPYSETEHEPAIITHRAWALYFCERMVEAEEATHLSLRDDSSPNGALTILRALIFERHGRPNDIGQLRQAVRSCGPGESFYRMHGTLLVAKLLFFSGEPEDASDEVFAALEIAEGGSNRFYSACAEHILAYCRLARGDLSGSEELCRRMRRADGAAESTFADISLPVLAVCRVIAGDSQSAREIARRIAPAGTIGMASPYLIDDGSWIRSYLAIAGSEPRSTRPGYDDTEARWKRLDTLVEAPTSTKQSIREAGTETSELVETLSRREIDVIEGVAAGMSNTEIGEKLFISVGTVKWHINNIFGKLGVKNRTSAIIRARELGIFS